MLRVVTALLVLSGLLMAACSSGPEYVTTESGLQYKFVVEGPGPKPEEGQILILSMIYKDEMGRELLNTVADGEWLPIAYSEANLKDNGSLEELFKLVKKGDSVNFKVSAKKVFEETFRIGLPDSIPAESLLTFEMGVKEVFTRPQYNHWQGTRRVEFNIKNLDIQQMERDLAQIDNYLAGQGIQAQKTAEGLRYIITDQGEGEKAKPGQYVSVNYTGRILEGNIFETSVSEVAKENGLYNPMAEPYQPYSFTLGWGEVVLGWDLGIAQLSKGGKAQLFIPSPMAYGNQAVSATIGANAILVFDVELVDIVDSN